jgi:CheY-like chemotaxis protein
MKFVPTWLALMLSAAWVLTGCQSPKAGPSAGGGVEQATRNNSYSLLHQLLDEQKDVSLLRFIKREHSDVRNLVKKIAAASGAGSKLLEEFARHDPSVILDDIQLPPGEIAAREGIAATKKKELLGQTGDAFELTLLLTQTEALSYAWHLAEVTGKNEPQPERARALAGVSEDMKDLYREVFVLLLSKTKLTAAN